MTIRRIIAAVQVIGAVLGVGLLVANAGGGISFLWLVLLAVHLLVGVAGVGLWRGTRRGLRGSIVAQAIQMPWIATAHVSYRLGVGLAYWVALRGGALTHDRAIGSTFLVEFRQGFGPWVDQFTPTFGVNLVALATGAYLVFTLFAKAAPALPNADTST